MKPSLYLLVSVSREFKYQDQRQLFEVVFPKKSILSKYINITEPFILWCQPKPIETMMLTYLESLPAGGDDQSRYEGYTSTVTPANYLHVGLSPYEHFWFYAYLRTESMRLYVPLDMSYINNTESAVTVSSCYLTGFFIVTYTNGRELLSLSNIYSSFTWVERELKEFSELLFLGLKDTRRLLTDYTIATADYTSYKTTSYDGLTQNSYY